MDATKILVAIQTKENKYHKEFTWANKFEREKEAKVSMAAKEKKMKELLDECSKTENPQMMIEIIKAAERDTQLELWDLQVKGLALMQCITQQVKAQEQHEAVLELMASLGIER